MEQDFYLDKITFRDSIRLCYDIPLEYLLLRCARGQIFNLERVLSYKKGGFITLPHSKPVIRSLS